MSLSAQAKVLRVLQEGEVEPVGSPRVVRVKVRVVAATNRDLTEMIRQGRFREDLYYRLAEISVEIPPLRNRQGDAALLAHAFVRRFAAEHHRGSLTLRPDALAAIEAHPWPGNVRELENCVKRAVIMADGAALVPADLGLQAAGEAEREAPNLRQVREEAEKQAIVRVLGRVNGNVSKAAELLGVSRPTLYALMERFGLR
jgi:two-component system NtrC family response regulator